MAQLSLFSAEARPALLTDLAGLLCGRGQVVRFGAGDTARLSVVLVDPARAPAVVAECAALGVPAETATTDDGATVVRTPFRRDLTPIADAWTRGAVKAVPPGMQLDGRVLRLWVIADGAPDERGGYLLAMDPHAPQTHLPLIAAATRAGLQPARLTQQQALRISGTRRLQRLVELVGAPPQGVPAAQWPWYRGRCTT